MPARGRFRAAASLLNPTVEQRGFPIKPYALATAGARFRHALFLDADNLSLADPRVLFSLPEFVAHGSLFWPDYWHDWVAPALPVALGLKARPSRLSGRGRRGPGRQQ